MKKIFLSIVLFYLLLIIFIPAPANAGGVSGSWDKTPDTFPLCGPAGDPGATGLVPCGVTCSCTISSFFIMLDRIYNFIVWNIATPLAVLALVIGGVLIIISAGNPGLAGLGKKMALTAVIGLVLVFCSWLIINFIMTALGYQGAWNVL